MEPELIGIVGWVEVKRHSRILYLRLNDLDVRVYDIRPGDKLKVEIHAVLKTPRDKIDAENMR